MRNTDDKDFVQICVVSLFVKVKYLEEEKSFGDVEKFLQSVKKRLRYLKRKEITMKLDFFNYQIV